MVPQEVVGQGHACGGVRDIDEAVRAGLKGAVVDPHVGGTEDGDAVAVRQATTGRQRRRRQRRPRRLAVAHGEPVDDDVAHVVQHEAGAAVPDDHGGAAVPDDHGGAAPVHGLVRGHDQLLLGPDGHVTRERDPQGLLLDEAVAEGARRRGRRVFVARVRHHVRLAVLAAAGVTAEPDGAVGEALPVVRPAGVAAPAVVDRVAGAAVVVGKHSSVQ
ncbi:hypothetical protein PVAP13_3NG210101 [Panicum virgatum]|uniref:Uncharacterized protein n=1 Tax=Panicum virgatum TaxID=38727 RepID=A0A8T0UIN7_PANVG|nr:hypothetical protein PVAP13_3NG210101 [Panicum virgatum]